MSHSLRHIFILFLGLGNFFLCSSQGLFLSPVLEFKNSLHLNDNRTFEGPDFTYEPQKINFGKISPINLGIILDYQFRNNNRISLGVIQDNPSMAYKVYFTSYDIATHIYFQNVAESTAAAFSYKMPLKFDIKLSEKQLGDTKWIVQRRMQISAALYYHKSSGKPIVDVDYGKSMLDTIKYISISGTQRANSQKAIIFSLSYSWDFVVNKKQAFAITAFVDYCPSKVIYQQVSVSVSNGKQESIYIFSNNYGASGFGIRLSKAISVWKPKEHPKADHKYSNE